MENLLYVWAGLEFNFGTLPQQLVNGLITGAIYALIALGYTMVYGVLRLINFAHGEVFMLGGYVALFVSWGFGFSPDALQKNPNAQSSALILVIMILVAMATCALIGAIIEYFAYRPMRNQSRIAALITAIGVSLFLQYAGQIFLPNSPPPSIAQQVNPYQENLKFDLIPAPQNIRDEFANAKQESDTLKQQFETALNGRSKFDDTLTDEEKSLGTQAQDAQNKVSALEGQIAQQSVGVTITVGKLIMLVTVIVLMALLRFLVMATPAGRAMRAVSHDFESASLMGINVNKVITFTFMLGSSLAGAGAMMLVTFEGTAIHPFFGLQLGVKAFVAAVLGGIGNIPGAVLGGFLMGLAETLVVWAGYSNYKDAVAFVILIVVLLLRPGGILGSNKVEKV